MTWHPSRQPATAQTVELRFEPESTGTRVHLVSAGWENWGPGAATARRAYALGWGHLLKLWAGQRTWAMRLVEALTRLRRPPQGRLEAGGEITD